MVFSTFKVFFKFSFFSLVQSKSWFWFLFLFHHEHIHRFFHFFFHVLFILLKTKKNLRFLSSQQTVTLPSQALPENQPGIAHAITEIGNDTLIIWNTFVEWSSTKVESKPYLFVKYLCKNFTHTTPFPSKQLPSMCARTGTDFLVLRS